MTIRKWFPTLIYDAPLDGKPDRAFQKELLAECLQIRAIDEEGERWCKVNYPDGYTSYGSMCRLHRMSPTFADLETKLSRHVKSYARSLDFDLTGRELEMTDCWVNIMPRHAVHGLHLHPTSTISGTYYVKTPKGCSSLKLIHQNTPVGHASSGATADKQTLLQTGWKTVDGVDVSRFSL